MFGELLSVQVRCASKASSPNAKDVVRGVASVKVSARKLRVRGEVEQYDFFY